MGIEKKDWEQAGVCGVDSGMIWIGDPCYALPRSKEERSNQDYTYNELVNEINGNITQINYRKGHAGLGVCVQSAPGLGGTYPVFVKKNKDGRIMEARIIFIEKDDLVANDEFEIES